MIAFGLTSLLIDSPDAPIEFRVIVELRIVGTVGQTGRADGIRIGSSWGLASGFVTVVKGAAAVPADALGLAVAVGAVLATGLELAAAVIVGILAYFLHLIGACGVGPDAAVEPVNKFVQDRFAETFSVADGGDICCVIDGCAAVFIGVSAATSTITHGLAFAVTTVGRLVVLLEVAAEAEAGLTGGHGGSGGKDDDGSGDDLHDWSRVVVGWKLVVVD